MLAVDDAQKKKKKVDREAHFGQEMVMHNPLGIQLLLNMSMSNCLMLSFALLVHVIQMKYVLQKCLCEKLKVKSNFFKTVAWD